MLGIQLRFGRIGLMFAGVFRTRGPSSAGPWNIVHLLVRAGGESRPGGPPWVWRGKEPGSSEPFWIVRVSWQCPRNLGARWGARFWLRWIFGASVGRDSVSSGHGCSSGRGVMAVRRRRREDVAWGVFEDRGKGTFFPSLAAAWSDLGAPVERGLQSRGPKRTGFISRSVRDSHGGGICEGKRAMSTTRKIWLTYNVCMLVMDNKGGSSLS